MPVEFGEDANLDGASLRENVIRVKQILVPVGKIDDGDAHDAVETAVGVKNRSFKLHPEDLLLLGGRR